MESDSSSFHTAIDSLSVNDNLIDENENKQVSETECPKEIPDISISDILLENENEPENVVTSPETFDITPEKNGGVLKRIIKEGEGEEHPGYGDKVSVHYTGWLLVKEPKEFDSSRKGEKFEFNLGRGMVVKGWDLGIGTMKKGEVSLFIVHPKYAYGDMGYPPTIPPYTPLLFEIELFGWKLDDLSPKKDSSILRKVLEKGEGNTSPNEGSRLNVKVIRYDDNDDAVLEEEKEFILGEGCSANIPEGIEIALLKFRQKERSLIYLKNKYAVEGPHESNSASDLEIKYEITLLGFERVKDIWEMNTDEKFERAKLAKEKGITFYKEGNYKVALKQFKWIITCLENEPGVPVESQESRKDLLLSGYLNIALCYLKLENYTDAIKICDKALAIDSNNEKALFRRGQAKAENNDCEEAMQDFKTLCSLKPDNKAAQNYIIVCQNKIKEQKLKDKSTYNKMFELFVKQDEERLKNMKTETGVWENENAEMDEVTSKADDGLNASNSALLNANVIELSNTANNRSSHGN